LCVFVWLEQERTYRKKIEEEEDTLRRELIEFGRRRARQGNGAKVVVG
jgi:hypothetical protein